MRGTPTALLAAAAIVVAGCGGDEEPDGRGIPAEAVTALESRLDEIQRRFDDATENGNVGACNDIQSDSFKAVATTVSQLPEDVDPEIRDTLEAGLQRLQELTEGGCADVEPPETNTTPSETAPPESTPEETETMPTETAPAEDGPPEEKEKKDKEKDDGGTPPGQGGGGLSAPVPGDDD